MTKVQNYRQSVEIKQQQVAALEESVQVARDLFNKPIAEEFARVEYVDVLLATRDLLEARTVLIETKQQQLSAIVNTYKALGGGLLLTTSGMELTEFFRQLYENQLYEGNSPSSLEETIQPSAPEEQTLPSAPGVEVPPPPS